jgi:hypothetical protein
MFFPSLVGQCDSSTPSLVPKELRGFFIDRLLLPACKAVLPPAYFARLPLSFGHADLLQRNKGKMDYGGEYIPQEYLLPISMHMKAAALTNTDPRLALFTDSFFVSNGYGLKAQVNGLGDFPAAFWTEINVAYINLPGTKVFLDFGLEMSTQFLENGQPVPSVNCWVPSDQDNKIKHLTILDSFFPDEAIKNSYYRCDSLLHFDSIAGCDYKPGYQENRPYGMQAVKMYPTMKHPFYHRQSNTNRHSKQVTAMDLLANRGKTENYFVSATIINFVYETYNFFVRTLFHRPVTWPKLNNMEQG